VRADQHRHDPSSTNTTNREQRKPLQLATKPKLHAMALRFGQILRGARWNYQLVESLGNHNASSIVFKAEMLPGVESQLPGKWLVQKAPFSFPHLLMAVFRAAIKTTDKLDVLDMLKREHSYYMKPTIRSSRYIRTMYEEINGHSSPTTEIPYCLAFEWMDCTLKDVPPESRGHNSFLHKIVSKAVLNVLANLKSQQLVHGGTCCHSQMLQSDMY
jgi:hypothetical protein